MNECDVSIDTRRVVFQSGKRCVGWSACQVFAAAAARRCAAVRNVPHEARLVSSWSACWLASKARRRIPATIDARRSSLFCCSCWCVLRQHYFVCYWQWPIPSDVHCALLSLSDLFHSTFTEFISLVNCHVIGICSVNLLQCLFPTVLLTATQWNY